MVKKLKPMVHLLCHSLIFFGFLGTALAQDSIYSFTGDAAFVSKYIWRGQRLTNDWSFQPAATVGIGNFSFNAWGSVDLTAVNEGDGLPLPEDPVAPSGNNRGLRGQMTEIDFTFSYSHSLESMSIDGGLIIYTFPGRFASLPSTAELYGGVTFDEVMLAPSATLYIDINESSRDDGSTGIYFQIAAGHSIPFDNERVSGLDISAWISLANSGFGEFYYGASESGFHDFNLTVGVPIALNNEWSASVFVTYSALMGGFREHQYLDPRDVLDGTAGDPKDSADTFWGGVTVSLGF